VRLLSAMLLSDVAKGGPGSGVKGHTTQREHNAEGHLAAHGYKQTGQWKPDTKEGSRTFTHPSGHQVELYHNGYNARVPGQGGRLYSAPGAWDKGLGQTLEGFHGKPK